MKNVVIYSTPTCHFCHMAKEFFTEHNVQFTDYNVATNMEKRSEMIEKSGQMGVPVIIINDTDKPNEESDLIIGFDEEALKHTLGIA